VPPPPSLPDPPQPPFFFPQLRSPFLPALPFASTAHASRLHEVLQRSCFRFALFRWRFITRASLSISKYSTRRRLSFPIPAALYGPLFRLCTHPGRLFFRSFGLAEEPIRIPPDPSRPGDSHARRVLTFYSSRFFPSVFPGASRPSSLFFVMPPLPGSLRGPFLQVQFDRRTQRTFGRSRLDDNMCAPSTPQGYPFFSSSSPAPPI